MRFTFFCLLFICICFATVQAQQDSAIVKKPAVVLHLPVIDSAKADSISKAYEMQYAADSLAMIYLAPDSLRENKFISSVHADHLSYIESYSPEKPKAVMRRGLPRHQKEQWILAAVMGLLVYTALLNLVLGTELRAVIQSFYNKQAFTQLDKEGGLINSWAYIGLFILFCFALGMVLYQYTLYKDIYYEITGFQLFVSLSVAIGLLFAFKFLLLKFLGFVFEINSLVSHYIAILNLTYFNIAFLLLAVAASFSLLSAKFIPLLLVFTVALIVIIFAWQYIRNSINIISNFRFHKFYLFIYLCALEICPVLILIKALNI